MNVNQTYLRVDLQGGRLDDYGYMRAMESKEALEVVRNSLVERGINPNELPNIQLTPVAPGEVLGVMGKMPEKGHVYWDFLNFES